MSKPMKAIVSTALANRYEGVDSACVVDLTGMKVLDQQSLRGMLREKAAELHVVKNSMAQRAFGDTVLEPLGKSLSGPSALVTSSESIIDAAKVLAAAAKEFDGLSLKEAIIDGDPILVTVAALSNMKGRLELMGEVAMLVSSPGRNIAGCLQSPGGKIAGCLEAIVDKAA